MKIFIFIFILFATLYTVNTAPHQLYKRTTTFEPCDASVPGLNVTIIPDPLVAGQNVTFAVVGITPSYNITKNKTILEIGFIHDLDNATYHDKTFNKSFPPNTTYSIKASDIPVPSDYDEKFWTTLVLVGDLDPDNPKILFVFGCSFH
ncbi:hypothetical protein F8M41_003347 [Gigaspora margarita]|uniref:MD-2-related lipid-recognition domain-containing protein n=1 Tax=Gigaspora margarita TaxID=4874 RepID=A0A8H3XBF2_GIGMA|nr:hypothetical protein F8M41_003347 [Gigaspora margarita]